jgi:hypothetical protein
MPACKPVAFAKEGGECHKRRRTQALGVMCYLRMWADTCFRISYGGMYTVRLG